MYVTMFSGLAIAYTAMTSINSQAAGNARNEQVALTSAESGMAIMRYHMSQLSVDGSSTSGQVFEELGALISDAFDGTLNLGQQHVSVTESHIAVPAVAVDSTQPGATFQATVEPDGDDFQLTVTGSFNGVSRAIRVRFVQHAGPADNAIMQHGIVSKGSVLFNGSIVLKTNRAGGSSIMSLDPSASTPIRVNGASQMQSDLFMVKPGVDGDDVFNGTAAWGPPGGTSFPDTDRNAHTHDGIDPPAWPQIDVSEFTSLINALPRTVVTSRTNLNGVTNLHNVYIEANANPRFNGGVTITGLVYVAYPNNVTFNGSMNITGVIICEPPSYEPSETASPNCSMTFNGSTTSSGVENLPQTAEYAGLHDKTGTFLIAKDYDVRFNGAMGIVNGSMYTSGLTLNGSTTGTIRGSVIVDRRRQLTKNGSVNLLFDAANADETPAGFGFTSDKTLRIQIGSYEEV